MATSRITATALFAFAIALAVVVLLATTPWSASPSSGSDVIQGDVDCDLDVDAVDALFDLKFVADIEPFGECTEEAGDTDCSGGIGSTDGLHILRFAGGFASTTPEDCTKIGTPLGESPTHSVSGSPAPTETPGVTTTPMASPDATGTTTPGPTGTPTTYGVTHVLDDANFDSMVDFAVIPGTNGEEAVVITQGGELWRISLTDAFAPTAFGNIVNLVDPDNAGFEEGLLSIAFPSDFTESDRVYLYYTQLDSPGNDCTGSFGRCSFISQFTVTGNVMNPAPTVIIEIGQPFENHNGGKLLFGPDGFLYLGLGDGGGDGVENGQDTTTVLGAIIRIDPLPGGGYKIPADDPGNPLADGIGGDADEIWAYGLRNPWRMSFDSETGDLWVGDVGEDDYEEADLIEPGGNYGWVCYEGPDPENLDGCPGPGAFEFPRTGYARPSGDCAIVGGYVYRGTAMPELQGWYIFGDFCSGRIRGYDTATNDPPVVLVESGVLISSFAELPNGELLVLTYENAIFQLIQN